MKLKKFDIFDVYPIEQLLQDNYSVYEVEAECMVANYIPIISVTIPSKTIDTIDHPKIKSITIGGHFIVLDLKTMKSNFNQEDDYFIKHPLEHDKFLVKALTQKDLDKLSTFTIQIGWRTIEFNSLIVQDRIRVYEALTNKRK